VLSSVAPYIHLFIRSPKLNGYIYIYIYIRTYIKPVHLQTNINTSVCCYESVKGYAAPTASFFLKKEFRVFGCFHFS
jgi:hypothetical protein